MPSLMIGLTFRCRFEAERDQAAVARLRGLHHGPGLFTQRSFPMTLARSPLTHHPAQASVTRPLSCRLPDARVASRIQSAEIVQSMCS
jgi:hypothetical protein